MLILALLSFIPLFLIFLVFLTLKLCTVIRWRWVWVFAPLWVPPVTMITMAFLSGLFNAPWLAPPRF
jgi:hypothetical protein